MNIKWAHLIPMVILAVCVNYAVTVQADNAYDYILPDSSWQYLDEADLQDMSPQVLCYARNEIYARDGRTFQSEELQHYFEQQYWYHAVYTPEQFDQDMLSEIEFANVSLLAQVEEQKGMYETDQEGYSYAPVYEYMQQHQYHADSVDSYYVDPNSYILYDSDRRFLTQEELTVLSLKELCYARNEIFARKGRIFQSQEMSDYFYQKNWYWGTVTSEQFSMDMMNEYEMTNADRLLEEENRRQMGGYALDQPGYTYEGIGSYTSYQAYPADNSDYLFWDSNIRYLTEEEVGSLSLKELSYARNEIYARRGYLFQAQELRDYFSSKSWYHGTEDAASFSYDVFNEFEKANIERLKQQEYMLSPNGYQLY